MPSVGFVDAEILLTVRLAKCENLADRFAFVSWDNPCIRVEKGKHTDTPPPFHHPPHTHTPSTAPPPPPSPRLCLLVSTSQLPHENLPRVGWDFALAAIYLCMGKQPLRSGSHLSGSCVLSSGWQGVETNWSPTSLKFKWTLWWWQCSG